MKTITLVLLAGFLVGGALSFPTQEPRAEFEVAAIKVSGPDSAPMSIRRTETHFTTSNTTLPFLIRWAYAIDENQLIGLPKGLDTNFDIVAKIPDEKLVPGRLQLMMQSLLADRFKLRIHRETRELTSYTLFVDKGGAKVRFMDSSGPMGQDPFKMTDRGRLVGTQVTAPMLATVLAEHLGRPVVDATELSGRFDFILEWTPNTDPASSGLPSNIANRPSLFTAIREQLGFRLDARKSQVEVIVVDNLQKLPTNN